MDNNNIISGISYSYCTTGLEHNKGDNNHCICIKRNQSTFKQTEKTRWIPVPSESNFIPLSILNTTTESVAFAALTKEHQEIHLNQRRILRDVFLVKPYPLDLLSPVFKIIAQHLAKDKALIIEILDQYDPYTNILSPDMLDQEMSLERLVNYPLSFKTFPDSLKTNPEFIIKALCQNKSLASEALFQPFIENPEFFVNLIQETGDFTFLMYAKKCLFENEQLINGIVLMLQTVKKKWIFDCSVPASIRANKLIMKELIKINPQYLKNATHSVQENESFAFEIVAMNLSNFAFVDSRFQESLNFFSELLKKHPLDSLLKEIRTVEQLKHVLENYKPSLEQKEIIWKAKPQHLTAIDLNKYLTW